VVAAAQCHVRTTDSIEINTMPLILSEEQTMLRDSARSFLTEQSPVSALRALRDSADATGFSPSLWQKFAEMGFTGVLVPESLGGLGLGQVEAGVVMAQIGHQLCASPLLASSLVAVTALRQAGSAAQQQHWLPRLASGEAIATLAVDEGAKHRATGFATTARADRDGWVIDGAKTLVLDGHVADLLIVAATLANGDVGLFAVTPQTAGLQVERTLMVDAHNAARLSLQGLRLSADARLGGPAAGNAAAALSAALDVGRAGVAAELLGLADEVFDRTVQYLKDRRQFGKAIGEFQALQHRAAHLYTELEISRAALLGAQQALDADIHQAGAAVAVAKARAGRTATLAVQEAVQMHGGMGMTDAFEIGFFMKRARVLHELWGDSNFHLDALARRRGF
jgi:alkylation response protein AidB-like acyl-CoA dehydrogenase